MVGKSLSHYKILEELGRGGMGIVYKAEDTKLDRMVAIKVLPSAALGSEDDRARFYREAKAAAQLHHPHIASVFEIDEAVPEGSKDEDLRPFISMEYIEGETLWERIQNGPLKLDEAIRIASQIASGLEAAHEKEIVHRDLKSQNVMLTPKGAAKILDFGLAQTAASTKLTRMGSTLGTVAYMSPEQAQGAPVDHRTDIWSLGVVLYEMIAGRSPFPGEYDKAVIYNILNQDPEPLTTVRTGVSMGLEWIVSKCLAKEAKHRYQGVTELLVDLETVDLRSAGMSRVSGSVSTGTAQSVQVRTSVSATPVAVPEMSMIVLAKSASPLIAATFAFALFLGYVLFSGSEPSQKPVARQARISVPGIKRIEDPTMTPDGLRVAFQGVDSTGRPGLYEYELFPGGRVIYFEGSEDAAEPNYSPDGRYVSFSRPGRFHLYSSGVPALQTPEAPGIRWGTVWTSNETYLAQDESWRIVEYVSGGGMLRVVATADSTRGHGRFFPVQELSADGRYATTCIEPMDPLESLLLAILDVGTGEYWSVAKDACYGIFVGDRYLVYSKLEPGDGNYALGTIVAQQIARDRRSLIGTPRALYENLSGFAMGWGADGTLLHSPVVNKFQESHLTKHDLNVQGSREVLRVTQGQTSMEVSPDGRRIAKTEGQSDRLLDRRIEITDLEGGLLYPLVRADSMGGPVWSPDGAYIYYSEIENGEFRIQKVRSDGGGRPQTVLAGGADGPALSPDGHLLAYNLADDWDTTHGVWIHNLRDGRSIAIDSTSMNTTWKSFSGNSKFIVYQRKVNDEFELVVRSIAGDEEFPIGSGRSPIWDTKNDLIYHRDQSGANLYRLRVTTESGFSRLSEPQLMIRTPYSTIFTIDFENEIAYGISVFDIDLNGPDAILNLVFNYERYLDELFGISE